MAPAGWATAAGKLPLFWGSVHEGFFQQFPERAKLGLPSATDDGAQLMPEQRTILENAIKARKKQIETWFRYQKKKITKGSSASASTHSHASLASTLFSSPARHRSHQAIEIFQRRHVVVIRKALMEAGYDELNSANIPDDADDWSDASKDTPAGHAKRLKSLRMQLRTRVVKQMFDASSAEEKASIEEELEGEKEMALKEEAEKEQYKKTPEALQISIDELTPALGKVLNIAERESGWVAMTIIGGPNPRNKGELSAKVVCTGETPAGNNFETFFPNFDGVITEEFFNFLRLIFPAEARAACALAPESGDCDDVVNDTPDLDKDADLGDESAPQNPKPRKKTTISNKKKTATAKKTSGQAAPVNATPADVAAAPVELAPLTMSGRDAEMLDTRSQSTPPDLENPFRDADMLQPEDISYSIPPATSGSDAEMLGNLSGSSLTDPEDPFVDKEPFPGASSDDFAALESGSILGSWSWADFVAGRVQSGSAANIDAHLEDSVMELSPTPAPPPSASLASSPWSSAATSQLSQSATLSTISLPPHRGNLSGSGTPSLTSGVPMSATPSAGVPPPMTDRPAPAPPPTLGFQSKESLNFNRRAPSGLFEAFRGKAPSSSTSFSFAGPAPFLTPPFPTLAPSVPLTAPSGTTPFSFRSPPLNVTSCAGVPVFAPAAPSISTLAFSKTLLAATATPSTPARQPSRAAQRLTTFLSPERRGGESLTPSTAVAATAVAEALAPPSASPAASAAAAARPAVPQTRPAAKQPVEKTAQPVSKARGRKKTAATEASVLVDATNGSTGTIAEMSAAPKVTVSAAHPARGAAAGEEEKGAPPPPPLEEKRAWRPPRRADGSMAVKLVKRTRTEARAEEEEEEGGPRGASTQASHKKRKTAA
ncbi:hypothetical protein C8J57DRAFT_1466085 [Mycena rebaudengoi]|nr:hypothetical protein C8J57DRAFT_1466085 [Mycena rebaudengoi]